MTRFEGYSLAIRIARAMAMNIEITAARATMNGTRVIKLQITRPSHT
jgi:hypothetical protein